jgi:hypothetical protein
MLFQNLFDKCMLQKMVVTIMVDIVPSTQGRYLYQKGAVNQYIKAITRKRLEATVGKKTTQQDRI